ncbi:tetratricopeptide repeat protein [Synoicihabitans lomoniglobus]|uniref:Tetratricopeptide repeat protein n=1 Tax=Synoicihabitans lomoniglobus TaxID=2909285 RepID=A0AAE9ZXW4_9BACT|nr:tetratricopeptide repeat protein [Opitutaceae bacterium LMO-M01]WED63223.1 tetratricopeptide repeat protein [Opitutaceae bacterium LMO-M01]
MSASRNTRWFGRASLAVIIVATVAGGWRLLQASRARDFVQASVPVRPDLTGWTSLLAGNLTTAEGATKELFGAPEGLVRLSRIYHANGFYPEAMACYGALQELQPGVARWYHLPVSILAGFGRLDDAAIMATAAIELAPDYLPARLRRGDILTKLNRDDEAGAVYEAVLTLEPGNVYALLGLARLAMREENWTQARQRLQQATAEDPNFIGALSLLVSVERKLGHERAADAVQLRMDGREFVDFSDPWLDETMNECVDAYRLSVAAAVARAAGKPSQAKAYLQRAILLDPVSSAYLRQLGRLELSQRDFSGARFSLEKAVEVDSEDSESWLQLIEAYKTMGDTVAANQAITKGLARCPESRGLHLAEGRRLNESNQKRRALAHFQEAYRLKPSEPDPLIEIAGVWFTLGRNDEALQALHEALLKEPGHPMAQATLCYFAISTGDVVEADQWWKRVVDQIKTPAEMRERLRQTYRSKFGREPSL